MIKKILLRSIEVMSDVAPLKAGLRVDFLRGVCFLVGDNGVGKSTVLECVADAFGAKDDTYLKRRGMAGHVKLGKSRRKFGFASLDLHAGDRKFAGAFGSDIGLQMAQMKASAGQSTLLQLAGSKPREIAGSLVLMDEPCRGLSTRNQFVVSQMILQMAERGNQLVVVTHSTLIMEALAGVAQFYDVSKGADVTYRDYIKEQLRPLG
jgi:predicted ATPase